MGSGPGITCTTCGYHENYISDAKKLSEAAQKWPKVPVI